MEPVSTLTTIASAVGVVKALTDTADTGLEIIEKAKKATGKDEISIELLRLALLEVDRNLALIAALDLEVTDDEGRAGLLEAAVHLKHEALGALLLQWHELDEPALPAYTDNADFNRWVAELDKVDMARQTLANARFVVSRSSVLACLAAIPHQSVKNIRLKLRYENIRGANLKLLGLLKQEGGVADLLNRRESA